MYAKNIHPLIAAFEKYFLNPVTALFPFAKYEKWKSD